MARPDTRAQDIKAIHAMKRELALTDDCYRALVSRISAGRVDSSAGLTGPERGALKDELRRLGAGRKRSTRPNRAAAAKPSRPASPLRSAQARMIRGLWIELGELGGVQNASEEALAAFVKRQTGIDALDWLTVEHAESVIGALKPWVARIKRQAGTAR